MALTVSQLTGKATNNTRAISLVGAGVKRVSPVITPAIINNAVGTGSGLANMGGNTVNAPGSVAGVGGNDYSNTSHVLPTYNGMYKNFGSIPYPGLISKQVDYQILDTEGAANDAWFLFDYSGLSGKTKASTVTIGVQTTQLASVGAGYTALKSYYGTSGLNPLFNSIRIQGDSSLQIGNPINFAYYDENGFQIQIKQVTPNNTFNQGDFQNAQGEFGLQAAITPNFVMWGSIQSTASTTNYILFTLYMQDYVGERVFAGAR